MIFFYKNDMRLFYGGLTDPATGAFINTAASFRVLSVEDDLGEVVGGMVWPVNLTYIDGSDGDWEAVLDDGLEVEIGQRYFAEVELVGEQGQDAHWRLTLVVRYRTEDDL